MGAEVAVTGLRPAADRKDEIVAVVGRVGERPVARVAGVSRSLERERQHARVVVECRVGDVLRLIGDRLRVTSCCPAIQFCQFTRQNIQQVSQHLPPLPVMLSLDTVSDLETVLRQFYESWSWSKSLLTYQDIDPFIFVSSFFLSWASRG